MIKIFLIVTLMSFGLLSCGQNSNGTPISDQIQLQRSDSTKTEKKSGMLPQVATQYIDTECTYTDESGLVVSIQNSLPKGNPYYHPNGTKLGRVIFWNRVVNESTAPIELTITLPAETYEIPPLPDSYLKLFIPPGIFTLDRLPLYNFGAIGLDAFIDANFNESTILQKTILPNQDCLFLTGALSYKSGGMVRAGLVLKGNDLFYKISIFPHFESLLFPCGQITLKE